jgi:hypothetical protein
MIRGFGWIDQSVDWHPKPLTIINSREIPKKNLNDSQAKVEDIAEFFNSISDKLEKIFENPSVITKSDVGHFQRQCSEVRTRVLAFVNVIADTVVACQGDERTKSIVPKSVNAIFDKLCVLDRDGVIDLLTRRNNECYLKNRGVVEKCVADNFDVESFENTGFCG